MAPWIFLLVWMEDLKSEGVIEDVLAIEAIHLEHVGVNDGIMM